MRGLAGGGGPAVSLQATSWTGSAAATLRPTVLPPDEAHGLCEVVGEARELGGAVGEALDGLKLLGGGGRDRVGLVGGRSGAGPGLHERLADLCRQLRDTARELRHALAGAGRAGRGFGDVV